MDERKPLRHEVDAGRTTTANRSWWDGEAAQYYQEHGEFLGDTDLVWGPEGWSESDLGVLGELRDRDVLEIGAGGAQGSRWAAQRGARVVGTDLSAGMLDVAAELNRHTSVSVPLVQADAQRLPFKDNAFDVVFTAYGVIPFVADSVAVMGEAYRVLRPGGRFVFSTTHPIRWSFPDDPSQAGLTATMSYWDQTPYVETSPDGAVQYAEHHRTLGERIREITAAGLTLTDLVEPIWRAGNSQVWGGWSPTRGAIIPGTAIFVTTKPAS